MPLPDRSRKPSPRKRAAAPQAALPAHVEVVDALGLTHQVDRETFRRDHLPEQVRRAGDDAETLAAVLRFAIERGFGADVLPAAERLQSIDPEPRRAAAMRAVALIQAQRDADAERVVKDAIARHGADGPLLVNLATIQRIFGEQEEAALTLARAVHADPNYYPALRAHADAERARGGPRAELAALEQAAALPGSWRARLWIARLALARGDLGTALGEYRGALATAGDAVPGDALMQISGDLGNAGHFAELVELCLPVWRAERHGFAAGDNLIRASMERGDVATARSVLGQLRALRQASWAPALDAWDHRIGDVEVRTGVPAPAEPLAIELLVVDGVLWAPATSPLGTLVPAKREGAARIAFVCGSVASGDAAAGEAPVARMTDVQGRVSRGLPLFLAERVHLASETRAACLFTLMRSAFALASAPWRAEQVDCVGGDWDAFVLLHVVARAAPWRMQWKLHRRGAAEPAASWETAFDPDDATAGLESALLTCRRHLREQGLATAAVSDPLPPPPGPWLPAYVVALEQTLAVYGGSQPERPMQLVADRAIFENLIRLCAGNPRNEAARCVLAVGSPGTELEFAL